MWYLTRYVYRFFIALAVVGAILSIHWGSRTTTTQEPIKELMRSAATKFAELLATESSTYPEAVAIYSRRRGRHPPPGFAEWYAMANATNAVMIEAFWDQIYKDLAPFWNITPEIVRSRAAGLTGPRINHLIVKEHQAHGDCEEQNVNCYALLGMIKSLAYALPDIDIPFNSHVSPRVFVPWEDRTDPQAGQGTPFSAWNTETPIPLQIQAACPPESATRSFNWYVANTGHTSPNASFARRHTHHGFVSDTRLAKDICAQPDLLYLHGTLIAPISPYTTTQLVPLLGSAAIPGINHELVIPAPLNMRRDDGAYWPATATDAVAPDTVPWHEKANDVFWRGSNTGGEHNEATWPAFHRHRLVAVANRSAEESTTLGEGCPDARVDIGFDVFECAEGGGYVRAKSCPYLDDHFTAVPTVELTDALRHRYLVDVDGNGFSGRFAALLATRSVPIKSTIFREWFDDRLVPWLHYVPMDVRYGEFWALVSYFLGDECSADGDHTTGHDDDGRTIAEAGSAWAARVLRVEDMRLFVFRLLLEFARVANDDREWLDEV